MVHLSCVVTVTTAAVSSRGWTRVLTSPMNPSARRLRSVSASIDSSRRSPSRYRSSRRITSSLVWMCRELTTEAKACCSSWREGSKMSFLTISMRAIRRKGSSAEAGRTIAMTAARTTATWRRVPQSGHWQASLRFDVCPAPGSDRTSPGFFSNIHPPQTRRKVYGRPCNKMPTTACGQSREQSRQEPYLFEHNHRAGHPLSPGNETIEVELRLRVPWRRILYDAFPLGVQRRSTLRCVHPQP